MYKPFILLGVMGIFLLTACEPIFSSSKWHTINFKPKDKAHKNFLVTVQSAERGNEIISLVEYQTDQTSKKPHYTPFAPKQDFYMNQCGRVKFSCNVVVEADNTYSIEYRGLFGEGTTSKYQLNGNTIIPISLSCSGDDCSGQWL